MQLEKAQPKLKLPSFPYKLQLLNLDTDGLKRKKALADYLDFVGSHPQLTADVMLINCLHNKVIKPAGCLSTPLPLCTALWPVCLTFFILQPPEAPIVLRVTPLQAMGIATVKKSAGSCFSPAFSFNLTVY